MSRVSSLWTITADSDLVPYFVEKSFNYIPVVENQRLIGIMSRVDMIWRLQSAQPQQF